MAGLLSDLTGRPRPRSQPLTSNNFLAAILANLLLGSDEAADDSYGAPAEEYGAPVDSYGEPAVTYEEPAPSYEQPSYEAPAPAAPEVDTYGSPAADPLPAYHAARY